MKRFFAILLFLCMLVNAGCAGASQSAGSASTAQTAVSEATAAGSTDEDIPGQVERTDEVLRLYAQLTPEEREFLNLRYVLELKDKEIATLLSQNEKTINKRYQRLLQKCREYL